MSRKLHIKHSYNYESRVSAYFSEHGCDFYVTQLYDSTQTENLSSSTQLQRFLGTTDTETILRSLEWSNLVVAKLIIPRSLENGNTEDMNLAEDHLTEQITWANFLGLPALMFPLNLACNNNLSRIIHRDISEPKRESAIWAVLPVVAEKSGSGDSLEENLALKSWRAWDDFRMSTDQHHRLGVALRIVFQFIKDVWFVSLLTSMIKVEIVYIETILN